MKTYCIVSLGLSAPFPHFTTLAAARKELAAIVADDLKRCKARFGAAVKIRHGKDNYEVKIGNAQSVSTWSQRAIIEA